MIRTLLTTTALTALLTGGAMAQAATATPDPGTLSYTVTDSDNLATEIIGKQVYASTAADAEHIGDINNLVVAEDGSIQAVVIGVGGFLGIGEKNVAVPMDQLTFATAADNTERYVLETTKEALNAAPAFEWADDEPADTAAAPVDAKAPNVRPWDDISSLCLISHPSSVSLTISGDAYSHTRPRPRRNSLMREQRDQNDDRDWYTEYQ